MSRLFTSSLLVFLFVAMHVASAGAEKVPTANTDEQAQVEAAGKIFQVEVVSTKEKRTLGLSGRTQLADNQGMLFVFERDAKHSFWMKNMNFSLDIAWIDKFGSVVHVARKVSPESWPKSFVPEKAARYVLEVRAGQLASLVSGDRVRFKGVSKRRSR